MRNRSGHVGVAGGAGWAVAVLLALAALVGVSAGPARAQWTASLEPRVSAGRCLSPAGSLLSLAGPERAWQPVPAEGTVLSRDLLLALAGTRADLEPRPHSVHVSLWGNLTDPSFPGRESAVVLHDSRAMDLDFTLVHGRVVLSNSKAKGAAEVWVRLRGEAWQLTLPEPGNEVAIQTYGRWPQGSTFTRETGPEGVPMQVVELVVLKGALDLKTGNQDFHMAAAPGRAYYRWDNFLGGAQQPTPLDRGPAWARDQAEPPGGKGLEAVARDFRDRLKEQTPAITLRNLLADADNEKDRTQAHRMREFAILGLAALGDVARVAEALGDPKHADARGAAITALRHWIAAEPGRDWQLYQVLVNGLGYRPAQAETVVLLLHNPFLENQPEAYETLIAYLGHSRLAVRELAWWHLYRLAPAGRSIRYDPAGPEAERQKAQAEWKKLIPTGQLPPREE